MKCKIKESEDEWMEGRTGGLTDCFMYACKHVRMYGCMDE
jgi:hypothetical protein